MHTMFMDHLNTRGIKQAEMLVAERIDSNTDTWVASGIVIILWNKNFGRDYSNL